MMVTTKQTEHPLSLRERAREREVISYSDPLSPTLPLRGRERNQEAG
jgi:hypothetical protein